MYRTKIFSLKADLGNAFLLISSTFYAEDLELISYRLLGHNSIFRSTTSNITMNNSYLANNSFLFLSDNDIAFSLQQVDIEVNEE